MLIRDGEENRNDSLISFVFFRLCKFLLRFALQFDEKAPRGHSAVPVGLVDCLRHNGKAIAGYKPPTNTCPHAKTISCP